MLTWPVGLRFVPTEEELVDHYLRRKLEGEVEVFCLIPELYVYTCEPPDLFVKYNELSDIPSDGRECFFFCPPGDKIPNNRRSNNRMTKFGYWKDTCEKRAIRSPVTGEQRGIRKIFVYYEGRQPEGRKTDIVMHQYHLNSEVSASKVSGPMAFVLCHIIDRKLKKTRSAKASTLASLSIDSTPNDFGNGMVTWPVGLRFEPTEEELVDHYLRGKLKGKLEAFCLIPELYIYKCEPPDLFIRYNELSNIPSDGRECFFFCPPGDKIANNRRSNNRMTKCGYWKDTCKERKIQSLVTGKQTGIRKIFVYYEGRQPKGRKTDIVMHQYHLNSEVSASKVSGPMAFVLCHIIKRKPKKARAIASTSASLSAGSSPNDSGNGRAHEISAQASEEVTVQTENSNEMSISSMADSNSPSIPQQAQMLEEQSLLYNGYPLVDGPSDECYAMPYSPRDFIEILDLWNVG
ncbi:NAC domain-containing protein 89-like [Rhodamnia argentea]|uniref:NAC domain-containing protein 89-like n=1 Tax=Rhodamnia argentea TaxID=178133 RepID=A0ABM3HDZ8_9MYRT|nr:NAC domain-containing protein 89-like [Rhodamnia argentea]